MLVSLWLEKSTSLKKTPLFALRGTISDRNNELLAWNSLTDTATTSSSTYDGVPKRIYTALPGFANMLGYVTYPKKDQSGVFWQDEYIGKDGIEKEYQTELAGIKGERIIEVSALHEVEAQNVVVYPTHGENIVLSIDKNVQAKLYERIEALAHRVGVHSSYTEGYGWRFAR
jgi:penicillin-binding protein 2